MNQKTILRLTAASDQPLPGGGAETAAPSDTVAEETTADTLLHDGVGDRDFGGKEFRIRTIENINVHNAID